MKYQDTKAALIDAGMNDMLRCGYDDVGIARVLKSLSIPKGSFYHYFASKEAFGCEIIEAYARKWRSVRLETFNRPELTPLDRLRAHFTFLRENVSAEDELYGCLLGNLAQLMSVRSDALRSSLNKAFAEWKDDLISVLEEAKIAGQLPDKTDLPELASTIIEAYEGALLLSKVSGSSQPLHRFQTQTLEMWFTL